MITIVIARNKTKRKEEIIVANKEEEIGSTCTTEERKSKIEHNNEVHEKMKNADSGMIGDQFVDDHYVPRCY